MTTKAEKMRRWRATPAGKAAKKAQTLAQNAAVSWVIANRPDVWAELVGDARVKAGLPRQAVKGRPPNSSVTNLETRRNTA